MKYFFIYLLIISLITAFITAKDKLSAKEGRHRTPEATLFFLAFFGGSGAEYITMKLIRHKTRHKRFMIGLPLIMMLQVILFVLFYYNI